MLKIDVPATTTNFGSGFDAFGLALELYNTFLVEPSENWKVEVKGYRSGIPLNESNLFIRVYKRACREFGLPEKPIYLVQENRVPPARGLGSSATAIVGGIEAALSLYGKELPLEEKLKVAFEFEKHPDNLLPAFLGGFVISVADQDRILYKKLSFPEELKLVFVIPDYELSTEEARKVLPQKVELRDAVFNLQRSALLVASLLTKDYELLREAVRDKLHQPYRSKLAVGLEEAISVSYKEGALATFLSGAGPTICSITLENEETIGKAIKEVVERFCSCKAEVKVLRALNEGVKVSKVFA